MSAATKALYKEKVWPDAPLFHQPWWLQAAAGDQWDVCLIMDDDNNQLHACFLYATAKSVAGRIIVVPPLTQFLGPNYKLEGMEPRKRLSEETNLLDKLMQQFPPFAFFESRWHFRYQNWLPFHWKRYRQTTRYTYILNLRQQPEEWESQFSDKVKREIAKAEKQFTCTTAAEATELLDLVKRSFAAKKLPLPFDESVLPALTDACMQHHAGRIYTAHDADGKSAASIFIAWDATTAYYIIGARNADYGNSGAMSLLFRNAFRDLAGTVHTFDFEGSMIKGVENYFRSFGAEQKTFFQIRKVNSLWHKFKLALKG